MIVASHCANDDGDIGVNADGNIFQPIRHLILNNRVAMETEGSSLHTFYSVSTN